MKNTCIPARRSLTLIGAPSAQAEEPSQVLFENVRVFDGTSDSRVPTNVLVEGNLIKAISLERRRRPQAVRIDGGGRTLMPGLIDSHAHFNVERRQPRPARGHALGGTRSVHASCVASSGMARGWLHHCARNGQAWANGLKPTIDAGLLDGPANLSLRLSYISQTSGHGDLLLEQPGSLDEQHGSARDYPAGRRP